MLARNGGFVNAKRPVFIGVYEKKRFKNNPQNTPVFRPILGSDL
jgi:hypothetical protein